MARLMLCLLSLALSLSYSALAAPKDDGVTVVPQMPAIAKSNIPATESVQLDNGDTVEAPTGSIIMVQRDPSDGTYTIGLKPGN